VKEVIDEIGGDRVSDSWLRMFLGQAVASIKRTVKASIDQRS
jgi:hypothetical protein